MYLKELKIENFKGIKNLDLKFENINVIRGPNGSGKSSIVEAIRIGLLPNSVRSLEDYIRNSSDSFYLDLLYYYPDVGDIRTILEVSKKSKSVKVLVNNKEITKKKEAYNFLESIGVDKDIFINSCISLQHRSTEFLFYSDSTKAKIFKDLFKLESIKKLEENLKIKSKIYITNASNLLKEKEQISSYLKEIKSLFSDFSNIDLEKIKKAEKIYNSLKKKKEKLDKDMAEYYRVSNLIREKVSLENQLDDLKNKIIDIKEKKYTNDRVQNILSKIENKEIILNSKLESLKEELTAFSEILKKAKEKIDLFKELQIRRKKRKELKEKYLSLKKYRKKYLLILEKEYDKTLEEKSKIDSKLEFLDLKIKAAEEGKCYVCGREFHQDKKELLKEKENLENSKINFSKKLENLLLDKKYLSNILREKESIVKELLISNREIIRIKKKIISEKLEYDKKLIKSKEKEILITVKKLETLKRRKYKLESKSSYLKNYIQELPKLEEKIKEIKKSLEQYSSLPPLKEPKPFNKLKWMEAIYNKYITKKALLQELKSKISLLKKLEKDIQKKEEEIKLFTEKSELLKEFVKIISGDFVSFILEKGLSGLELLINSILEEVYPKYKVKILFKENSLIIYYTDGTYFVPLDLASGFELQLLSLAFRASFSKYYGHNLLVLDEADESASEENSEILFDFLYNLKEFQIIYVSHKKYLDTRKYTSINLIDLEAQIYD